MILIPMEKYQMSHKVFDLIKTMSGYGRKRLSYNVNGQNVEIGLPVLFF